MQLEKRGVVLRMLQLPEAVLAEIKLGWGGQVCVEAEFDVELATVVRISASALVSLVSYAASTMNNNS